MQKTWSAYLLRAFFDIEHYPASFFTEITRVIIQ